MRNFELKSQRAFQLTVILAMVTVNCGSPQSQPQPTSPTPTKRPIGLEPRVTTPDPTEGTTPPNDPTVPWLRGQGWYCHTASDEYDSFVLCRRTAALCQIERNESAEKFEVTPCRFKKQAACLLAMDNRTGAELSMCIGTLSDCERLRMRWLAEPQNYKFVTPCQELE